MPAVSKQAAHQATCSRQTATMNSWHPRRQSPLLEPLPVRGKIIVTGQVIDCLRLQAPTRSLEHLHTDNNNLTAVTTELHYEGLWQTDVPHIFSFMIRPIPNHLTLQKNQEWNLLPRSTWESILNLAPWAELNTHHVLFIIQRILFHVHHVYDVHIRKPRSLYKKKSFILILRLEIIVTQWNSNRILFARQLKETKR